MSDDPRDVELRRRVTQESIDDDLRLEPEEDFLPASPKPKKKVEPRKRRSLEEIITEVEDYAFNGEGADKFRALKMLHDRQSTGVVLSPPLNHGEAVERLARLMKPYGNMVARYAYRKAFPYTKGTVANTPEIRDKLLTPEIRAKAYRITTVRGLYKEFPEIKRPGTIPGFPRKAGPLIRAEWCRKKALACYADRERAHLEPTVPPEVKPEESIDGDPSHSAM